MRKSPEDSIHNQFSKKPLKLKCPKCGNPATLRTNTKLGYENWAQVLCKKCLNKTPQIVIHPFYNATKVTELLFKRQVVDAASANLTIPNYWYIAARKCKKCGTIPIISCDFGYYSTIYCPNCQKMPKKYGKNWKKAQINAQTLEKIVKTWNFRNFSSKSRSFSHKYWTLLQYCQKLPVSALVIKDNNYTINSIYIDDAWQEK